ncbi:ATP-binding cassette domain-containing protein [Clostridiaceae bacterium M8S5]|nr:ATP-binding cassette domain-containing protein [Clostridiaceae bacterium M8S5]
MENLVEVKNLKKYFRIRKNKILKAVDDVSFSIKKGETLGLVGESGCGKTTCGRTIARLYSATDGIVKFNGEDIHKLNKANLKSFKKDMQMIFQDPYASLNPRMTVGSIILEGLEVHYPELTAKNKNDRAYKLLELVGLNKEHFQRFPHEFSGGQRQRIGIARALAVEPKCIVCDEPISALDVSIQAQIVNLLIKLQKDFGLTYLFIAHDLSMVKHISDRVGVMYLGALMEITSSKKLYSNPLHPYTKALISAIPIPDPDIEENKKVIKLEGEVPSPINPKPWCKFSERCKYVSKKCREIPPKLKEVEKDHFVACHLF